MFLFYNIEHLILLRQLKLIQSVVDDGCKIITSEFRLSYYSGTKQYQVRNMIEQGLVVLVEQPNDLPAFIEEFSEAFSYAGEGVLLLMHLCINMQCTLIIEDEEQLILDVAAYFDVPTIAVNDFYKQKIKDIKYYEFLINAQKK